MEYPLRVAIGEAVPAQETLMDPLTEMHLLLREHGWEPETDDGQGMTHPHWVWTLPGCTVWIITFNQTEELLRINDGAIWSEYDRDNPRRQGGREPDPPYRRIPIPKMYLSVAGLRRRLKALTPQK